MTGMEEMGDMEELLEEILAQYDLEVDKIVRTRGGWLLYTDAGLCMLREVQQKAEGFEFTRNVREYLETQGMEVDCPVANKKEEYKTQCQCGEVYAVYRWYPGEHCDFRKNPHLFRAGENLGKLHSLLKQYPCKHKPAQTLLQQMERYNREMKRVFSYMKGKKRKSLFEYGMMESFHPFYKQAWDVTQRLEACPYYQKNAEESFLCHGEYNYHNLIFHGAKVFTSGFERVTPGMQLTDLAYFVRKVMEKNNWDPGKGREILLGYEKEQPLSQEQREFVGILLAYPMKYRKLLNQYMNGKKSWISQKSMEKLNGVKQREQMKMKYLKNII